MKDDEGRGLDLEDLMEKLIYEMLPVWGEGEKGMTVGKIASMLRGLLTDRGIVLDKKRKVYYVRKVLDRLYEKGLVRRKPVRYIWFRIKEQG